VTREEIREYAEGLILWRSKMIEPWDVVLQAGKLSPDGKVPDEIDLAQVLQLIETAEVSVHFES
jgi:hypothetical protein